MKRIGVTILGQGEATNYERTLLRMVALTGAAWGAIIAPRSPTGVTLGILIGALVTTFLMLSVMRLHLLLSVAEEDFSAEVAALRVTLKDVRIKSLEKEGSQTIMDVSYSFADTEILDQDAKILENGKDISDMPNPFRIPLPLDVSDQIDAEVVKRSGETGSLELYGIFNNDKTNLVVENIQASFPSWKVSI